MPKKFTIILIHQKGQKKNNRKVSEVKKSTLNFHALGNLVLGEGGDMGKSLIEISDNVAHLSRLVSKVQNRYKIKESV